MRVIPAIDLLDNKVVRLRKGDYNEATVYNDDPLEEAEKFKKAGFSHIHVVDLNGAREGRFTNMEHIRRIIDQLGLSVQTGGGIRSFEDAAHLLDNGISQIICSSMAIKKPGDWFKVIDRYSERAILGMDLKDGKVAYGGWLETSDHSIEAFLNPMIERGLTTVLSTDISRDGTLEGPNIDLYKDLISRFPAISIIASGGVGDVRDLIKLAQTDVSGVVVGRAYYEGNLSLEEMQQYHSD